MKNVSEKYFALLPLALFCIGVALVALRTDIHDFANYYFGGLFLREGQFNPQLYFPYHFNQLIASRGHELGFAGFAPNTPFLALVLLPLTFLKPLVAKFVFNTISIGLFLAAVKRLADFYKITPAVLFVIPLVFFTPLKNELLFGQVYLLVFFCIAESWLAGEKGHQVKAGVFLSIAIMLKVFPVLLLLPLGFQKRYKAALYTIIGCGILVISTLPFCQLETWRFYFTDVLSKASNGGIASAYVENYQSIYMFLKRLLVFEPTENPGGVLAWPAGFGALNLSLKILLVTAGFYLTRKTPNRLFVISYWLLAIVLLSPYGSTYTFILMLFPLFAIATTEMAKLRKAALLLLLFFVNNFPISAFIDNPFPLNYLRLFCLLAFFVLMFSLVWKAVDWKMVSGVSLAALLLSLLLRDNLPRPDYFLKDSPLLIYDYTVENNRVSYKYWDRHGSHSQTAPMVITSSIEADLTRNEIYYYGKFIPSDKGHKQKPMVVNGKTLLYLSDADRGIGFYTLRKIDLP